ncbi:FAD-binding oxidoreductase [Desulfobacter sp.]|uniref:FAD-binding oxidoreductase n=1 Tax=Desulfobacter sp. TaxID=2294 RepID=UPI003D11A1FE
MISEKVIQEIKKICGPEFVSCDKTDRILYSYDATRKQFLPDAVVHPADAQTVSRIMTLAHHHRIPVYPRGSGTGFTGGALPVCGGMVMRMSRMNRILDIDQENLVAVVEPGVVTGDFQKAVEALGLFYPPDPASLKVSSLGGNVAECAGGPRCVKYGVTKDYVIGLEVVTPTGDRIETGGTTMKGVVGYDLTKLFCGSEGTLAVITKIILKLLPKPQAKKTMLVVFDAIDGAAKAVSAIIREKIIPATLEFMDRRTLDCVRQTAGLSMPEAARAALIIEVDGDREFLDKQTQRILAVIESLGVLENRIANTFEESEEIWKIRRAVSPSLRKLGPDKYNEDICVPRARLPEMIRRIEKIADLYNLPIVNFGHAGDGNIHVNIIADKSDAKQKIKAEHAIEALFRATLELGGTMSGEHGVGIMKAPYLSLELSAESIRYMKMLKKALDPHNILNPGKIFPDAACPPPGEMK